MAANGTRHPVRRLHWGGLKGFVDGSLGARTALLHEPYEDAPGYRGLHATDPARLAAYLAGAHAMGLQVGTPLCETASGPGPSRLSQLCQMLWCLTVDFFFTFLYAVVV